MNTLSYLAIVVACTGAISEAQSTFDKRSFSLNVFSGRQLNQYNDGAVARRKALSKYGMDIPAALQRRQAAPQTNVTATDIAVTEMDDLEYLSPVLVGDTAMMLDFDTGSSDLWVFSNLLPSSVTAGHDVYDIGSNSTGTELQGSSWQISYADGSGAQGLVYADKVVVGGATATSQAVEAATSISTEFVSENSDGLMGLGFGISNTIRPQKQPTFFENIKSSLQLPVFAVSLKKNATGTYDFGFIDPNKYTVSLDNFAILRACLTKAKGEIQYIGVNSSRGYWEFTMTGYAVGNATTTIPADFQAIADTGTTLMLLPPAIVDAYYVQVPNSQDSSSEGGFVFPCDTILPDLTVTMGGGNGDGSATATIPGELMNRSLSTTGSGLCYGGIQQTSDGFSIWGDVFLKSQFVVFDGSDPPRLGFAPQADGVSNNATTTSGSPPSSTASVSIATESSMLIPNGTDLGSGEGFTFAHNYPEE